MLIAATLLGKGNGLSQLGPNKTISSVRKPGFRHYIFLSLGFFFSIMFASSQFQEDSVVDDSLLQDDDEEEDDNEPRSWRR